MRKKLCSQIFVKDRCKRAQTLHFYLLLRLPFGVVLEVVASDFIGVDVDVGTLFSVSESRAFPYFGGL